jgi:hypothetical protein
MKKIVFPIIMILGIIIVLGVVSAVDNGLSNQPMILRTIKEIKSVSPSDVANLGFGVYQVSAQYNLGSYHQGKWMGFENKNSKDIKTGAVWVEFGWDRPETNVVLIDGSGNERKIYLPASTPAGSSTYGEYYWIAEDGSSYYANSNHTHGWPDLSYNQALVPAHLARDSLSLEQRNPTTEEPTEPSVGNTIKIKGQLVDQMTNEPISDARLSSAYEFSPKEVVTDSNGNFEFTVSSDYTGSWTFSDKCHGWAGNIGLQKNYESSQEGSVGVVSLKYNLALRKEKFDAKEEVQDVSGKNELNIGKIYAWPEADISIQSDIDASFDVMYKYKNGDGYNGGGNSNLVKEHYLSSSLPIDYDVFIQFKDSSGNEYKSEVYRVPTEATCGVVTLKYINGQSSWSVISKAEPTEKTGPIKIDIPESVKESKPEVLTNLCYGCLKETTCYPVGYRKSGEYCSESKSFISQLKSDSACDNSFECTSNVCVSGKCISEGFIQKIINWFKKIFGD